MEEQKFNSELNEYKIIENKKDRYTKQLYWNLAIGLQQVDGLTPSNYLLDLSKKHINDEITNEELEIMLKKYYSTKNISDKKVSNEKECDLVSARIVELISDDTFSLHPISLKVIHKYLFDGIYDFAGKYRTYNISKEEVILNGDSVRYFDYIQIEQALDYDFNEEKKFDYSNLTLEEVVKHIATFTSRIWEVHPFGEGNTRTTAVLIVKYLGSLGYKVDNDLFKEHSIYFRNALVRSNYSNPFKNISTTEKYLIKFYENLLLGTKHKLRSRDLMIEELFKERENEE